MMLSIWQKVSSDFKVSIKPRGETFVSKWTTHSLLLVPPFCCSSFMSERKPCWERKARMVNLLFQETSNLLLGANVTLQRPVLRKAGDSELFLVSTSSLFLFLLMLPLSSSPLHLCPSLYYSEGGSSHRWNTPMHTGITEASQFTSTPRCVCVCMSQKESKGDGVI